MRNRFAVFMIVALFTSIAAFGQEKQGARFGNSDVITLVKAGIGDSVVIAKIKQASAVDFKLETDDLVRLKAGGVSPDVISAMLTRTTATTESAPRPRGTADASGRTGTVVFVSKDGRKEIAPPVGEFSTTGFNFVTFTFLNYPGLAAKVRTDDVNPYILVRSEFDPKEHYYVVKLDPDANINSRSLKVEGKGRGFSESAGIRPASNWMREYSTHEDEEGIWRITPAGSLEPGEYGVFDGMRLFGFGIGHP
jgi:hypothetical protein